ncbi:hypothetical protein ACO0QE_004257 [Hanseniaspora vineae]
MSIDTYIDEWSSQISKKLQDFQETVFKEINELKTFKQAELRSTGSSRSDLSQKLDKFLAELKDYREDEEDLQRFLENTFENNYSNLKNILKLEIISFQSKIDCLNAKNPQDSVHLKKKYWKLTKKIYLELLEKRKKLANRQEITNNINIAKALYNVEELESAMYSNNKRYPQPFTDLETIVKLLESGQFKLVKLTPEEARHGTQIITQSKKTESLNHSNANIEQIQKDNSAAVNSTHTPAIAEARYSFPHSYSPPVSSSLSRPATTDAAPVAVPQKKRMGRPPKRKLNETNVQNPTTKSAEENEPIVAPQKKRIGRPPKRKMGRPKIVKSQQNTSINSPATTTGLSMTTPIESPGSTIGMPVGNTFSPMNSPTANTELRTENYPNHSMMSTQEELPTNSKSSSFEKANDTAAKAFSELLGKNTSKNHSQRLKKSRSRMTFSANPIQALGGSGYFSIDFGEEYSDRGSRRSSKPLSYKE